LQAPVQLAIVVEKQEVTVAAEAGSTISVEPDNNATALTIRGEDLLFLNDSDPVFNPRNPLASNKPDFMNRQYGGNIGGPVGKKAYFFRLQ
jgi:hypothetical protein